MARALAMLPLRWRRTATEGAGAWRITQAKWGEDKNIDDLREALADKFKSLLDDYTQHLPELWHVDENGAMTHVDVAGEEILQWTSTTYGDARLGEKHANGKPKAFVLFTFPPAPKEQTAPAATDVLAAKLDSMAIGQDKLMNELKETKNGQDKLMNELKETKNELKETKIQLYEADLKAAFMFAQTGVSTDASLVKVSTTFRVLQTPRAVHTSQERSAGGPRR